MQQNTQLRNKIMYIILWPPDAKSRLIGKAPDARKDWGQEEKGMTENEMVGWHHQLDVRGFGWTPGAGDGQGGLVYCGSWDRKELDMTEQLNWIELIYGQFSNKEANNVPWQKDSLLNTGFWKNWTDTCKGMKPDYHRTPYTKINLNWIKDLKIRPGNTELLEGNVSGKLLDIVFGDDFF